jgi:cobalt-zinc-cadmium efflux system membrane fusion protein
MNFLHLPSGATFSNNMKNRHGRAALIAVSVGSGLLWAACSGPQAPPTEAEPSKPAMLGQAVLTADQFKAAGMSWTRLEARDFSEDIAVTARFELPAAHRASVGTHYGGYVREMRLLPGQEVRKGQTLLLLESPELVQLQQRYLEASSQLAYLEADAKRQQALSEGQATAQKSVMQAQAAYEQAQALRASLAQQLALMGIEASQVAPERLRRQVALAAPISGIVTAANVSEGQYLSPGAEAVALADHQHIHLVLQVFERDFPKVKIGQEVKVRLPDQTGPAMEAEVSLLGASVAEATRTIEVHAHLKRGQQAQGVVPGMYAEGRILASKRQAQALPAEAVVPAEGGWGVWVAEGEGGKDVLLRWVPVEVGATEGGYTEVVQADRLPAGALVLAKGGFQLSGG